MGVPPYIPTLCGGFTINISSNIFIHVHIVQVIFWYLCMPYILVLMQCVVRAGTSPKVKVDMVPACNSSSGFNVPRVIRAHVTPKLHTLKTVLDARRCVWRTK